MTFLNGDVDEPKDGPTEVHQGSKSFFKKTHYGSKQSSTLWYYRLYHFLTKKNGTRDLYQIQISKVLAAVELICVESAICEANLVTCVRS